ncbi:VTT domain-containing protein [Bacillus sp. 31A1R]|uniref:TVP38/TMEM64 family membrane protein n=1 Tax=Robertmurraya mangrovi TaxID=3098077 RepID=A0ABU5IWC8_9BACI|nr:VTT domain-containing protein [Bacillus sp. 31A1R]MDZ5471455.1 VTT domain-containing protein [Bacillus sp. 31A1R]
MKKKMVIVFIWILAIYILKKNHLLTLDLTSLQHFISNHTHESILIFVGLWVIRLFILIPGVTLMILGGICFNPLIGFVLSMIGMIVSETIVYLLSKTYFSKYIKVHLERKHPEIMALLDTYNYKFLGLGIICPLAPTDVICFLSASVGLKYWKYLLTVLIANTPMMLLYSFVGTSLNESILGIAFVILSFGVVAIISIKIWYNIKRRVESEQFC